MKRNHIGLYAPSEAWGGLEMVVARFADYMTEQGHRVTLFGLDNSKLFLTVNQNVNKIAVKKATRLPFLAGIRLASSCRKRGIGILIATTSKSIFTVSMAGKYSRQLKTLYWQHMQIGHDKTDFLHTWFYQSLDLWITLQPWLKNEVLVKTRMKAEKVKVIPLGLDIERINGTDTSQTDARERLNLEPEKIYIGMIGRFDPNKNQSLLLAAYASLDPVVKEQAELVFVGDTTRGHRSDYRQKLVDLAHEYGISDKVHFIPFQKNPATAFRALDFMVMATASETYGLVTIEAMINEIPVIGAAGGGTVQLMKPDHNTRPSEILELPEFKAEGYLEVDGGVLFIPDNSGSLNRAIRFSIANLERLQAQAQKQKQAVSVRKTFNYNTMIEQIERVFNRLLNSNNS